jgi:hypothetical protein
LWSILLDFVSFGRHHHNLDLIRFHSSRRVLHFGRNCDGLDAHRRHTHQEIDHFLLVVREAIGVELLADGWVFGFLFFVLVENPFERRPVAKSVIPSFGRDVG